MADDAPLGQKTLAAPDGCGFNEEVVLPIRVHLMCQACKVPMLCTGPARPSLITGAGPQNQRPKFGHMCPACKHHVVTEQPWPQIRHEPHPHIAIGSPEDAAAQQAAFEEAQRAVLEDAAQQHDSDIAAAMAIPAPDQAEETETTPEG